MHCSILWKTGAGRMVMDQVQIHFIWIVAHVPQQDMKACVGITSVARCAGTNWVNMHIVNWAGMDSLSYFPSYIIQN